MEEKEKLDYTVTENIITEAIIQEVYTKIGYKTYICLLILNTGYEALGTFSPVEIEKCDLVEGKKLAREHACAEAKKHLEAIAQWRKTINDIREAELDALDAEHKNS